MPATPSDIALYTTDGVRIMSPTNPATGVAIKTAHPNAQDLGTSEIEMFYVSATDAQAMLDEMFGILSRVAPPYLALEIDDTIGFGSTVPIAPTVPSGRVFDTVAAFDETLLVRSYAQQMGTDRYAIEMIRGT